MPDKIRRWAALHPNWTLTFATLAALAPFLAKPFNIDDPLFIWVAHQIQAHPLNPYGFTVDWGQTAFPMWKVTQNPPLACYYLALAAGIFGWSEIALHCAFLLPATAVVLGTHRLAQKFCGSPMLAALATLFTPVFLVSSTTVMCDVMMLAFWVWAIALWAEGMERDDSGRLAGAALLVALATLTKYYGACLIPLLAVYSFILKRRFGRWSVYLLIPVLTLCAYQFATEALYGYNLLYHAADYSSFMKGYYGNSKIAIVLTALAFTGGCAAVAVFFAPLLWRARELAMSGGGAVLIAIAVFGSGAIWGKSGSPQWASPVFVKFQIFFWASGGISVLALAATDVLRRRDARSCLLVLWVLGTFSFTAFCNWTVNARSILPLAPAVGILIARRLEQNSPAGWKIKSFAATACLVAGAALAFSVACADFLLARAARDTAREVCASYQSAGRTLWFQGHWGFQYYMESLGASPLDIKNSPLKPGDNLAMPLNNATFFQPNPRDTALRGTLSVPGPQLLTTMDLTTGGGFYASVWGPLPFAFGRVPPETVSVYVLGIPAR